jgi:LysR family transcriptional regulator for metE and metH
MITAKDLELVRRVAESGSLTAAATQMHVSQSAISQRLANLQDRLSLTLFERVNSAMQLTSAGDRVYTASKIVGAELESTLADLDQLNEQQSNQLRITTECYTCYRWLPFVIAKLRGEHPSLMVDVVPDATDAPYDALNKGDIDVAIVSRPPPDSRFSEHALFEDEMFAVMSTTHELAKRKYLNPAQFADQTLVLYTGNRHAIMEEVLTPANIKPKQIIQVRITEAIVELARSGHGIAVIAGWALDDFGDTAGLTAVRITRGGFKRDWRAIFGEHCAEEHVDAFLRAMRETGSSIHEKAWRRKLQAKG